MGFRNDDASATSGLHFPLIESVHKHKTNRFSFLCAIIASMSSVLLGYGQKFYILPFNYSSLFIIA